MAISGTGLSVIRHGGIDFSRGFILVNKYVYTLMTTEQVQVRIPKEMLRVIDAWVKEGKFASRSDAIKTIVALHQEKERTRAFYKMLMERSEQAKKKPQTLVPLEEIN